MTAKAARPPKRNAKKPGNLPDGRPVADFDEALRSFVVALLQERGISETQLGAQIGLSQQNLNRFMRGGGTRLVTLARVCAWAVQNPDSVLAVPASFNSGSVRKLIAVFARIAALEGRLDVADWLIGSAEKSLRSDGTVR
jgi:DNA-binding Xre family transcriptional regulator